MGGVMGEMGRMGRSLMVCSDISNDSFGLFLTTHRDYLNESFGLFEQSKETIRTVQRDYLNEKKHSIILFFTF